MYNIFARLWAAIFIRTLTFGSNCFKNRSQIAICDPLIRPLVSKLIATTFKVTINRRLSRPTFSRFCDSFRLLRLVTVGRLRLKFTNANMYLVYKDYDVIVYISFKHSLS